MPTEATIAPDVEILTAKQAAALAGIHYRYMRKLMAAPTGAPAGYVRSFYIGADLRTTRSEIAAYIEREMQKRDHACRLTTVTPLDSGGAGATSTGAPSREDILARNRARIRQHTTGAA